MEPLEHKSRPPNVHFIYKNQWFFDDFDNSTFSFLAPLEPPPWSLLGSLGSLETPFGASLVHLGALLGLPEDHIGLLLVKFQL